jgi:hypothetical protein
MPYDTEGQQLMGKLPLLWEAHTVNMLKSHLGYVQICAYCIHKFYFSSTLLICSALHCLVKQYCDGQVFLRPEGWVPIRFHWSKPCLSLKIQNWFFHLGLLSHQLSPVIFPDVSTIRYYYKKGPAQVKAGQVGLPPGMRNAVSTKCTGHLLHSG